MGKACSKCAGFDQMQEDIKMLKEAVQVLNGNMGNIEKGTKMVESNLPAIDQAKNMLQTKVDGLMGQMGQVSKLTSDLKGKVDNVEADIYKKVPDAKKYMD